MKEKQECGNQRRRQVARHALGETHYQKRNRDHKQPVCPPGCLNTVASDFEYAGKKHWVSRFAHHRLTQFRLETITPSMSNVVSYQIIAICEADAVPSVNGLVQPGHYEKKHRGREQKCGDKNRQYRSFPPMREHCLRTYRHATTLVENALINL